jgi:PhnB protein
VQINPYLHFNGNCGEAFTFYERCLRGKIEMMHTYGDSPMKDQVPPDMHKRVMHVHLVADGQSLFGSDTPHATVETVQGMSVSLGVPSLEDGQRIFRELSQGGSITVPFEKTFWSPGFGMVTDRFGTPWMVNVEHKP